ncbi:MAG: RDD family protein [Chitinophagaceae bacterium]|nr:RDD family protein [Chitinophagaceae bacterium]
MSIIQIPTTFNIDIEFEIAEFHKRLLAYLVDFTLMILYLISMLYLLIGGLELRADFIGLIVLVVLLPLLFYTLLTELWMNGQTPGKKLLKIRVVSLDGGEANLAQYLTRWFLRFYEWGFIVFFFFYGSLYAGFLVLFFAGISSVIIISISNKSQRLGDMLAGTVVVNTRSALTLADTVFMEIDQTDYNVMFPQVMRLSDRDINTIKGVLTQANKRNNYEMCNRVSAKVKDVLKIESDMYVDQFLEKLLSDYNYLATRE